MTAIFPDLRLRRLRKNPGLRSLIRETELNVKDLVLPLFIKGIKGEKQPILSIPGHFQIPISQIKREVDELLELGISSVLVFGIPLEKDSYGANSCSENGIVQEAIKEIRKASSDLLIISDICLCEYTDHGHCGILTDFNGKVDVDNDKTLRQLEKQAVSHAEAGADVVAPSGMIDGMVSAIRKSLDRANFFHIPILSYSVKYQSSLYGPFRDAAEGAPSFGDRSSHQMDPANVQEALREVQLDVIEAADMLMVKPAHAYMDVICRVKQNFPDIPLGAYHTSGEFGMLKAAVEKGWLDERKGTTEILTGIKRAGADFIITYYAKEFAKWEKGNN